MLIRNTIYEIDYLAKNVSEEEARRFMKMDLTAESQHWDPRQELDSYTVYLRALAEDIAKRPSALPATEPVSEIRKEKRGESMERRVFIVHGRDEATKLGVARFLEKLELDPIILHEQASRGRTIIENIEDHSDVAYVVVLLTADDIGKLALKKNEARSRTRQNVVFELGFFIGKLGRERVCALYEEGVELPSDFKGVIYIPLDKQGGWKLTLARELKGAGLEIDLDRAV